VDSGFQSPIYGSRTPVQGRMVHFGRSFNPLSTGHARRNEDGALWSFRRFNPLSTGHARHQAVKFDISLPGFQSPIYGSRTGRFLLTKEYLKNVSIPYLRVTHAQSQRHRIVCAQFQSPIYGSRTVKPRENYSSNFAFQSPIYGSRTLIVAGIKVTIQFVSIPYLRVTHRYLL